MFVDDVKVGVSPMKAPVLVDMGERRIRVAKDGFQDLRRRAFRAVRRFRSR